MIDRIFLISMSRTYKALFMDDRGQIKPEAERFFKDMYNFCGGAIETGSLVPVNDETLNAFARRREVYNRMRRFLHMNELDIPNFEKEEIS